jgi:UDP-N-acetylglucosamine pyrophosphorylase
VHRLVRDFEEEQSEKENQIHHLKATATNTIRNLYALNGLTGENILNNLDAHQLKKSIPTQVDHRMSDARKRVSFENIHSRFLSSSLSKTGDRADVNETIDLSKSQKLMSPHRKRTAAYTQATAKSSFKKANRDSSSHSAKKDRDTSMVNLGQSTPAKFTKASKNTGKL